MVDGKIMNPLNHAIDNLEKLFASFSRQGKLGDAIKVSHELFGYQDVRDGVPRERREQGIHHVELLYLYRQARADAERLSGKKVTA